MNTLTGEEWAFLTIIILLGIGIIWSQIRVLQQDRIIRKLEDKLKANAGAK